MNSIGGDSEKGGDKETVDVIWPAKFQKTYVKTKKDARKCVLVLCSILEDY